MSSTNIPDETLIEDLREVAANLGCGGDLTQIQYERSGGYSYSTQTRRFGGWPEAKAAAGLIDDDTADQEGQKRITISDLLEDLRRVIQILRRRPTMADYDRYGQYSDETVIRRLGKWDEAIEAAIKHDLPPGAGRDDVPGARDGNSGHSGVGIDPGQRHTTIPPEVREGVNDLCAPADTS